VKNRANRKGDTMRAIVRLTTLSVAAAAVLLQASALAQTPQGPAVPGPDGQLLQDPAFTRTVAALDRGGEDAGILSEQDSLRPLGHASVGSLLAHRNRYIKALAISELRLRKDTTHRAQIHKMFRDVSVDTNELHSDPHESAPLSPDAAVLVAAAEYLASADKGTFLPSLLDRPEIWLAPHWFVPAVRHLGSGWIRSSLAGCPDPAARSVLAFLIRAGATVDNVPELQDVLGAGDPAAWPSAVVACERLDDSACWAALDASLDGHDALDQLTARMAEWRKQRVSAEELFAAAQSLVTQALSAPPGPDRARMWNKLDEFVRLAVASSLAIPRSLVTSLRALGSPVIAKDLAGALAR
jgi:hypothetical protein